VLTGDEPALSIDSAAVGEPGRLNEDTRPTADLVVAEHPVVRDVAEEYEPAGRVISRTLQPAAVGEQAVHPPVAAGTGETLVQDLEPCRHALHHAALLSPRRPYR
jgi:hypothetical protein